MKPGGKRRRVAGILAVAAMTAACTASPPAAWPPARHGHPALELACTNLPAASPPAPTTSGPRSPLDMPPVPGGLADVAARSSASAVAVGLTVPTPPHSRALVALWNGAVWTTLNTRALPPESQLAAVALFPGGAWAVGEAHTLREGGRAFRPLMVRVTGTTVRKVLIPKTTYGSALEDVAATSAADAWAVGLTLEGPLILHWNGTAWTRAQLPATAGHGAISVDAVAATSTTNAWAVIRFRTGRFPRLIHWNGRQWGQVVTPHIGRSYGISSVAATSANNVWAVGGPGVILHWNGRRWTCALSPDNLEAVSTSSADNAWAVGFSGYGAEAVAWHWNGDTWKQVTTPGPDNSLDGVAIIPRSGGAWVFGGTGHGTLMLHWNGTAWR